MADTKPASLLECKRFFEIESTTGFSEEWKKLTVQDQIQIKEGIGNGTLNYQYYRVNTIEEVSQILVVKLQTTKLVVQSN